MKRLDDVQPTPTLRAALLMARDRITSQFKVDRIVLFGSTVEGTSDAESDVDLLIVLMESPSRAACDRITSVILDIDLEYETNLSELIVDRQTWDYGLPSALAIHEKIEADGIPL
jgi:predicted nucleotidyltransferase